MKNIHILPTDKLSRIYKEENIYKLDNLVYGTGNQNIYITNDEEIKEGDWYCFKIASNGYVIKNYITKEHFNAEVVISLKNIKAKKIILTTDQDLIKDGVQAIDNEFLEWFVMNQSCEEVEIQKILLGKVEGTTMSVSKYKIIIPKEEPKQETLEEAAEKATFNPSLSWESEFAKAKFIEGAKWQQKRSYSEDEVLQLLRQSHFVEQNIEEWFNRHKK